MTNGLFYMMYFKECVKGKKCNKAGQTGPRDGLSSKERSSRSLCTFKFERMTDDLMHRIFLMRLGRIDADIFPLQK